MNPKRSQKILRNPRKLLQYQITCMPYVQSSQTKILENSKKMLENPRNFQKILVNLKKTLENPRKAQEIQENVRNYFQFGYPTYVPSKETVIMQIRRLFTLRIFINAKINILQICINFQGQGRTFATGTCGGRN